jgi:hypothetical protein
MSHWSDNPEGWAQIERDAVVLGLRALYSGVWIAHANRVTIENLAQALQSEGPPEVWEALVSKVGDKYLAAAEADYLGM